MTAEIKAKRQALKDLSAGFRVLVKDGVYATINEGLANYYATLGHKELKSYRQWKAAGFQVKKGSKALLFWGEPKRNKEEAKTPVVGEETEKREPFYPLAYLFSQLQVEPLK